jgi:uncharacterized protein
VAFSSLLCAAASQQVWFFFIPGLKISATQFPELERIILNPMIMGGKPCIRGMRITVGTIVGLVASGASFEEILQLYPYLESDGPSRTLRQKDFRHQYGPWAVVTGASSGIGREIALRLAASGLNLILVARRQGLLEELGSDLGRRGIETRVIAADLGTKAGIEAVAAGSGDLDVGLLVAAAGFGTSGPFLDSDLTQELVMLDVNCRALLWQSLHFGRRFAERGRGGLIFLASLVGFQGTPFSANYAATKAYVQSLAEALHVEFALRGVDVLASAPGPVQSGFAARAGMRMGAALKPADVAQATLDALGCKTTVVPGLLSKILTYSLIPLPRSSRVRMMGWVMRGMTKHRDETTPSKDPKLA